MSKRDFKRSKSRRTEENDEAEGSGRRRSLRRAQTQDDEEEEEPVEPLSKRKGSGSRKRAAEAEVIEEEAEDNEDGDEADEDGEPDTNEPETDGGLWGIAPIKKMKVSATAKKASEAIGSEEVKRQANDLARLALFCEHRRVTLKREDITKKVLHDKNCSKAFPVIFNRAQKVLQYTFGYEMIELRMRGMDNEQLTQAPAGNGQEESEGKDKGQAKSKTYILRSVLPAKLIAKMPVPNTTMAVAVNDVNGTISGGDFDNEGVMVDWKRSGSELSNTGLLYLVLSLILLNGRSMSDDQLKSYLRRMSLDPKALLPHALQPECTFGLGQEGKMTMNDYLDVLVKQSYLECSRTGAAPAGAMSMDGASLGKRVQAKGRKSRAEEGRASGEALEWRWGARAESEVTEKAVGEFIADIYINTNGQGRNNDTVDEDEDDGDGDADEKTRRSVLQHVEHAAGSALIS